jgi:hypothetical protein
VYDRSRTRRNVREAERVAELIVEHLVHSPRRSLGVVTFSQAQREAIDRELEIRLRERPQLEDFTSPRVGEGLFVKSLENVQGDERDVMLFSVGYGRDAQGSLSLNFGPLNGQDGARRLNVAITRAREQVRLVSSILPTDLDTARTLNQGVRLLRAYMEYCLAGGQPVRADPGGRILPSHGPEAVLSAALADALRARGLTVHSDIGAGNQRVDLAVLDPEGGARYVLGIELEGATFRASPTARDRERLRFQVLEGLGWSMVRVRARDWVTNPEEQIERIMRLVSSLDTPHDAWTRHAGRANTEASTRHAESAGANDSVSEWIRGGIATYRDANLPRLGTLAQFFQTDAAVIEPLLVELVRVEGPVHRQAAVRRLAECWRVAPSSRAVQDHLDPVLSQLVEQQVVQLHDDFLWPAEPIEVVVRQPPAGREPRPIQEIAPEEIAKAAYLNLQNAFSLTEQDLIIQTAQILGYARVGEPVEQRIRAALVRLEATGLAKRGQDKIEVVIP